MEINLSGVASVSLVNPDQSVTEITVLDLEFYLEEARSLVGGSFLDVLGPNADQMDQPTRNSMFQKYRVNLIKQLSTILVRNYKNNLLSPGVVDLLLDKLDDYKDSLKKSTESTIESPVPTA